MKRLAGKQTITGTVEIAPESVSAIRGLLRKPRPEERRAALEYWERLVEVSIRTGRVVLAPEFHGDRIVSMSLCFKPEPLLELHADDVKLVRDPAEAYR